MRKLISICTMAAFALSIGIEICGQAREVTKQSDTSAAQKRITGEVTAIDPSARRITIRTDAGDTTNISIDEKTVYLRVPPNERRLDNAVKITLADVSVGDRILTRGSQLFVMSKEAAAQQQEQRGVFGRITALNPAAKEITLMSRSREGMQPITIAAAGNVRFLRYAPDSVKLSDARPSSFAELKIGDLLRASGAMSPDRTRFTAEEIVAGSFHRTGGRITAINPSNNEITIRNGQTGETFTVIVGQRSTLRRIPPEFTAPLAPGSQSSSETAQGRTRPAGDSTGRNEARPRACGRNFQEMIEKLPALTLAELKKGDTVLVTGTTDTNPSRITAVMLVTGDADFLNRLQQLQGPTRGAGQSVNPGLPGDVLGGGTDTRDQPSPNRDQRSPNRSQP